MAHYVPQIRVFIASPGDVNEERLVVHQILDMLEYDLLFQKDGMAGVSIHAIAWDKAGADTAMRATKTPQTAIKEGLPRPSDCDIVLVLFWGRMGTPLPQPEYQKADGSAYLSGTEWEYLDALEAERKTGKPVTLIYRRTEEPKIDRKDRHGMAQYYAILDFFEKFRDSKTGALLGGYNEYDNPESLRLKLLIQLRPIIYELLKAEATNSPSLERPKVEAPAIWEGSPFPGLRAFTEADEPIFFGRGLEASELVKRVETSRFVAVVAASGSGKSSLVSAGLIPRLRSNAIVSSTTGSKDWRYLSFTPGKAESPFAALFNALNTAFSEHQTSPYMIVQEKQAFIETLAKNPQNFGDILDALFTASKAPRWTELFIFIDQFEELFTLVLPEEQAQFIAWLDVASKLPRLRFVVTMRSDFYAKCLENPVLAYLMKEATYPLGVPTATALLEMIKRPAERAALEFDEGLPEFILHDTGLESGSLALLAYVLDELYQFAEKRADRRILFEDYKALEGVQGAIGKRAEQSFKALAGREEEQSRILARVFRDLVEVDERGTATRQRCLIDNFSAEELAFVKVFTDARLLVTNEKMVEVAHEALFSNWERLRVWIEEAAEDLIQIRQTEREAIAWANAGRNYELTPERIEAALRAYEAQGKAPSEEARNLLYPQKRWLAELEKHETSESRRLEIGDMLDKVGDIRQGTGLIGGIPDIFWQKVKNTGQVIITTSEKRNVFQRLLGTNKEFSIPFITTTFCVSKYLTTYIQYQAFVDADDGYYNLEWWKKFPKAYRPQRLDEQRTKFDNNPRDRISWYQAMAFSAWLNYRYHGFEIAISDQLLIVGVNSTIRLPTEWEWQWISQNGLEKREYPWGAWRDGFANTIESGLGRAIAVGMYPQGASECGAFDLAGNLYEWCLNDYDNPKIVDGFCNGKRKVLRGGSFSYSEYYARSTARDPYDPSYILKDVGMRVVLAPKASLSY